MTMPTTTMFDHVQGRSPRTVSRLLSAAALLAVLTGAAMPAGRRICRG